LSLDRTFLLTAECRSRRRNEIRRQRRHLGKLKIKTKRPTIASLAHIAGSYSRNTEAIGTSGHKRERTGSATGISAPIPVSLCSLSGAGQTSNISLVHNNSFTMLFVSTNALYISQVFKAATATAQSPMQYLVVLLY